MEGVRSFNASQHSDGLSVSSEEHYFKPADVINSLLFDVDTTKLSTKKKTVANSVLKINMETEKRFARLRVLSNTVITTTETTSLENKETSEYPSVSFQPSVEPTVVENIYTTYFSNEKP